MEQSVLITGKQSTFTDDLIQESTHRVSRVIASYDQTDTPPEVPDTFGDTLMYLPWTRRSLISARTMMLSIDQIDIVPKRAIVVCAPEGINTSLHETDAATIEATIDNAVKGYLFIVREIAAFFVKKGGGDLSIVWYDAGIEVLPPVDAAISGAVQTFTQSMLTFYENETVAIRGLYASDSDSRAVARWTLEQVFDREEKSAGRRQKYGQRMGLLPFRR